MWKTLDVNILTYINLFVKVPTPICKNFVLPDKCKWTVIKTQNPSYEKIKLSSMEVNYIWNLSYKDITFKTYWCYCLSALYNKLSYKPVLCNIFENRGTKSDRKDSKNRSELIFEDPYVLRQLFLENSEKKVMISAFRVFNQYYYTDETSYLMLHLTALVNVLNRSENPVLEADCIEMLQASKVDQLKVILGYYKNYCNGELKLFEVLQFLYGGIIANIELLKHLYSSISRSYKKDFSLLDKICEVYNVDKTKIEGLNINKYY